MEKEKKWLTYDSTIGEFPKVREDVINYISKEEGLWKIAYDTEGRSLIPKPAMQAVEIRQRTES